MTGLDKELIERTTRIEVLVAGMNEKLDTAISELLRKASLESVISLRADFGRHLEDYAKLKLNVAKFIGGVTALAVIVQMVAPKIISVLFK